jgi:hypothetical protein
MCLSRLCHERDVGVREFGQIFAIIAAASAYGTAGRRTGDPSSPEPPGLGRSGIFEPPGFAGLAFAPSVAGSTAMVAKDRAVATPCV